MKKVLLTLDGSECSKAAIPVTKELAASLHADVVLVTVGNLPESGNMAREEKVELLGMLNRIVREFGLQADTTVDMSGDAAEGILKVADDENVDLIVMATHGRSGLPNSRKEASREKSCVTAESRSSWCGREMAQGENSAARTE